MYRNNSTAHRPSNSFTSQKDLSQRMGFRRHFFQRQGNEENSAPDTVPLNINRKRNNCSNQMNTSTRSISNDENISLISNKPRTSHQNNQNNNITSSSEKLSQYQKIKIQKTSKELMKKLDLNEIMEEEKQKEENITSEIKDTVKCYICFDIITKPKMCPYCHRIACEKCLYNWFMVERKKNCGFCRKNANFYEMVSVPFMSTIVDFVEKVFEKDKNGEIKQLSKYQDFCPNHPNEKLFYYCLDCNKGYCQTCFVFFGEEKDRHLRHDIREIKPFQLISIQR